MMFAATWHQHNATTDYQPPASSTVECTRRRHVQKELLSSERRRWWTWPGCRLRRLQQDQYDGSLPVLSDALQLGTGRSGRTAAPAAGRRTTPATAAAASCEAAAVSRVAAAAAVGVRRVTQGSEGREWWAPRSDLPRRRRAAVTSAARGRYETRSLSADVLQQTTTSRYELVTTTIRRAFHSLSEVTKFTQWRNPQAAVTWPMTYLLGRSTRRYGRVV